MTQKPGIPNMPYIRNIQNTFYSVCWLNYYFHEKFFPTQKFDYKFGTQGLIILVAWQGSKIYLSPSVLYMKQRGLRCFGPSISFRRSDWLDEWKLSLRSMLTSSKDLKLSKPPTEESLITDGLIFLLVIYSLLKILGSK